ncbi:hypothetical protein ACFO1B_14240 [Dactylosporangium siamense]|uniref:hypothetical protein n=1 Tax=Dactylosporangium siamense TaxID=685454 RepID=UPI0019452902|nr:hypothetical protein [Dactylosporangium siamense]
MPGAAVADPLPTGQCTTSSGVILAVDFSRWGGPLLRSCGTTPTTGYQLLNQGGWKTTGTQHDGPAFICRIGYSGHNGGTQYPTAADEKCVLTPPASAYWSYWHADPGQNSWVYSQLGAMSYKPKPGSVDLWIFGATNIEGTQGRPTISPDNVRARNTAPITTAAPPPPPAPTGAAPGGASPPATVSTSSGADPSTAVTSPPGPSPSASGTDAATTPNMGWPSVVDAVPTPVADRPSAGSGIPTLITVGVLLVLAVAGGAVGWRRRRRGASQ